MKNCSATYPTDYSAAFSRGRPSAFADKVGVEYCSAVEWRQRLREPPKSNMKLGLTMRRRPYSHLAWRFIQLPMCVGKRTASRTHLSGKDDLEKATRFQEKMIRLAPTTAYEHPELGDAGKCRTSGLVAASICAPWARMCVPAVARNGVSRS